MQPGSGNVPVPAFKEDAKGEIFLLQNKFTSAQSYRFTLKDWETLRKNALIQDRIPVFRIDFEKGPRLMVVSEGVFERMTKKFEPDD